MLAMGEYKLSVPVHTCALISYGCISGCERSANIIYTIK